MWDGQRRICRAWTPRCGARSSVRCGIRRERLAEYADFLDLSYRNSREQQASCSANPLVSPAVSGDCCTAVMDTNSVVIHCTTA